MLGLLSDLDESAALSCGLEAPRQRESSEHDGVPYLDSAFYAKLSGSQRISKYEATLLYAVALFCSTTALLFADQSLLAPNLTDVARDLGLSDRQRDEYLGGLTNALFFMFGVPAALLVGYLLDHHDRPTLLWLCVVIGEAPCIATVLVTDLWQLLLTRALTGIAIGGATPLIHSLLADLFKTDARVLVSMIVGACIGAGQAIGSAVAGTSGLGWRTPFAIVGIPSVVLATLMWMTTKDPRRGGAEEALQSAFADGKFEYTEKLSWQKVLFLARIPTNWLMILQGLPGCLPWGMVGAFLNDYLEQEGGMSKRAATLVLLFFGVGGAIGGIFGGVVGQAMWNWRPGSLPLFAGSFVWLGMPPLFWLVNENFATTPVPILCAVGILAGLLASVAGVNVRPVLINVNEPETRGIVIALQTTLDDLGKGLGPALVAAVISWAGRKAAFNIAICGWVPCGLMMVAAGWFVSDDEAAMQLRLRRAVDGVRQEMMLLNSEPGEDSTRVEAM